MRMYPFQFSGGMNQRVMIATSMILSPKIIIADEPTKGLDRALARDVTSEIEKIMDLTGASLLLITHDISLAAMISDRDCGDVLRRDRRDGQVQGCSERALASLYLCLARLPSRKRLQANRGCLAFYDRSSARLQIPSPMPI